MEYKYMPVDKLLWNTRMYPGCVSASESAAELGRRLADAQTTVEALRRELLEWKRALCGLTPGGSEFADDYAYCAEWVRKARENQHDIIISKHRKLKATQAALNAELEKVKDGETAYRKLSEKWNVTDLELTQLQARVRALQDQLATIEKDLAPINLGTMTSDDMKMFDKTKALVMQTVIARLMRTLDATTPAGQRLTPNEVTE